MVERERIGWKRQHGLPAVLPLTTRSPDWETLVLSLIKVRSMIFSFVYTMYLLVWFLYGFAHAFSVLFQICLLIRCIANVKFKSSILEGLFIAPSKQTFHSSLGNQKEVDYL